MTLTSSQVVFADVGQGDCRIVADFGSMQALVIDCPSGHVETVHKFLVAEGLRLSTLVVTHWDRDHYGGVARLAKKHQPESVHYNHDTLFPDARGSLASDRL